MVMENINCKHDLFDIMVNNYGVYEMIGLKFCVKCKRIYKNTLQEVKY